MLHRLQTVDFDLLAVRPEETLLDVGCGPGNLLYRVRGRVRRSVGLDLSAEALRAARVALQQRQAGPGDAQASFVLGDGRRLPFREASFDSIICTETLEHVADDGAVLSELARVLKPGGRLAVSVPDTLPEVIQRRLAPWSGCWPGGHLRIYGRRTILQRIERAGLRPYLKRWRHSLEGIYWILLYMIDSSPWLQTWADRKLKDWRQRLKRKPYSLFYHFFDDVGNRFLPKSAVIYARKPPPTSSHSASARAFSSGIPGARH